MDEKLVPGAEYSLQGGGLTDCPRCGRLVDHARGRSGRMVDRVLLGVANSLSDLRVDTRRWLANMPRRGAHCDEHYQPSTPTTRSPTRSPPRRSALRPVRRRMAARRSALPLHRDAEGRRLLRQQRTMQHRGRGGRLMPRHGRVGLSSCPCLCLKFLNASKATEASTRHETLQCRRHRKRQLFESRDSTCAQGGVLVGAPTRFACRLDFRPSRLLRLRRRVEQFGV